MATFTNIHKVFGNIFNPIKNLVHMFADCDAASFAQLNSTWQNFQKHHAFQVMAINTMIWYK